jgi:hypothetical protein
MLVLTVPLLVRVLWALVGRLLGEEGVLMYDAERCFSDMTTECLVE